MRHRRKQEAIREKSRSLQVMLEMQTLTRQNNQPLNSSRGVFYPLTDESSHVDEASLCSSLQLFSFSMVCVCVGAYLSVTPLSVSDHRDFSANAAFLHISSSLYVTSHFPVSLLSLFYLFSFLFCLCFCSLFYAV